MKRENPKYWLQKRSRVRTGSPMATVIFYGPTADIASKVVVGIIPSHRDRTATELFKWFDHEMDLRQNSEILNEVLDCLDKHGVRRVAKVDTILGCPHEEGPDYLEGEVCPHCPYWANRDRLTGELLQ